MVRKSLHVPCRVVCRLIVTFADKPTKPLLVELRNGKLVFKQKALSFEKMSETLQGASLVASSCPHATTHNISAITFVQKLCNSEK